MGMMLVQRIPAFFVVMAPEESHLAAADLIVALQSPLCPKGALVVLGSVCPGLLIRI